jgi:hypothetical protein
MATQLRTFFCHRHLRLINSVLFVSLWISLICFTYPYESGNALLYSILFVSCLVLMSSCYMCINNPSSSSKEEKNGISNIEDLNELSNLKAGMFNAIVHDMKNPINRILSATRHKNVDKEEVVGSCNQMLLIIENILDVGKMQDTKLSLKLSNVNFSTIVSNAIKQVNYLLTEKNISVYELSLFNSCTLVDEKLMERVIVNILVNAIKYSNINSSICVRIVPKINTIRIEIIDEGEGFETKFVDKIFDRYYQVKPIDCSFTGSTGIGLTFCKLVVSAHGGTIGAKSELHKGTTIWFELPIETENSVKQEEVPNNYIWQHEYPDCEDEILVKYKLKISNFAIYQTGEILGVLESAPIHNSPNFLHWKKEILKTSMTGNVDYFNELTRVGN